MKSKEVDIFYETLYHGCYGIADRIWTPSKAQIMPSDGNYQKNPRWQLSNGCQMTAVKQMSAGNCQTIVRLTSGKNSQMDVRKRLLNECQMVTVRW